MRGKYFSSVFSFHLKNYLSLNLADRIFLAEKILDINRNFIVERFFAPIAENETFLTLWENHGLSNMYMQIFLAYNPLRISVTLGRERESGDCGDTQTNNECLSTPKPVSLSQYLRKSSISRHVCAWTWTEELYKDASCVCIYINYIYIYIYIYIHIYTYIVE